MKDGDRHMNGDGGKLPTVTGENGAFFETSRRDFLKVLGVAGAGAAATSCGPPDMGDKLIPYLVPPEDIVPGTNVAYATLLKNGGPEHLGLYANVRDGRVIKLEGNPRFPNRGRLSALAQSALQDLYDPDRIQGPRKLDANGFVGRGGCRCFRARTNGFAHRLSHRLRSGVLRTVGRGDRSRMGRVGAPGPRGAEHGV